ncbi:cache domain-containing sensor histidine kinase [Metabacillus litoralis]|uniref:cache domain-containing sensor histidine kinase n=1 Tax=Metabacillus litoralis TaxID=152268 RepID=UPI00203B422D|nr:sensor histidine kinase [Metabacillus litoralis]MCM3409586.1 histidine kinase [Metabacillus litoralis]
MNLFFRVLSKRFTNKSIQFQLLITHILVILIPIIIIAALSYVTTSRIITKEVTESNEQLVEGIERNIQMYLKQLENDSKVFSARVINNNIQLNEDSILTNVDTLENIKKLNDYLSSTFDSTNEYNSIRIFSNNGDFINSSYSKKDYHLFSYDSLEDKKWRSRMFNNKNDKLIVNIHPIEKGVYSFTASKPVINPFTGERIGYISFDKTLASFGEIFKQFESRNGSSVQIINPDQTILYHTEHDFIGTSVSKDLVEIALNSNEKSITTEVNGEKFLIVSSKIEGHDLLIIGTLEGKFLSDQLQSLRNIILVISIISLFSVLILSIILSIKLSNPIKQLSKIMSSVEDGNLDITINVPKSNIETDVLTRSFTSMVNKIKYLIKTQYESEIHRKNAELKALLMQINPHFLYNTLEVIEGIADNSEVYEISDISQSLSKMLRYSIDLKQEKVFVQQEVENCLDFFLILKSRFEEQLIIEHHVDPEVCKYMIVKMTLQPLIENSIKHGVEKKIGTGFIKLTVSAEGNKVVINIEDNGVGFAEDKYEEFQTFIKQTELTTTSLSSSKSLGLRNVYSRLKMVFGEELEFTILSTEGKGTIISVKFPALETFQNKGVEHDD